MTVAAILLAAGRSTRFGDADKLVAPLHGRPLALHAAETVSALPLPARFVVAADDALCWPGFTVVHNHRPEAGMAHSIGLGLAAARESGATAVLIALADMPFVPLAHFSELLGRWRGPDCLVASSDGARRMPPVLFGANWFDALARLFGDRGARELLSRAELVMATPAELFDIDRASDLDAAGRLGPR